MSVVTGPDNQREEKISSLVRLYEKICFGRAACTCGTGTWRRTPFRRRF